MIGDWGKSGVELAKAAFIFLCTFVCGLALLATGGASPAATAKSVGVDRNGRDSGDRARD